MKKAAEKIRNHKWIVIGVLWAVSALVGCRVYLARGVLLGDYFCEKKSATLYQYKADYLLEQTSDDTWRILTGETERTATVTVEGDSLKVRAEFSDGQVINGYWYEEWGVLENADHEPMVAITSTAGNSGRYAPVTDLAVATAIVQLLTEGCQFRGHFVYILMGGLVYLAGALQFLYPEAMFLLFRHWMFRDGVEFSDLYLFINRIVCLIFMGFSLFLTAGGWLVVL